MNEDSDSGSRQAGPSGAMLRRPLPYVPRLQGRKPGTIDLVVIHCTELPDLDEARRYGEKVLYPESGTGNSGHYYIDRDGSPEEWVPPDRIAHHVRGHNPRSVGIELVNRGRWPDWYDTRRQDDFEPYPEAQLQTLVRLLRMLAEDLPALVRVAGHEDLDRERVPASNDAKATVYRKRDPGPTFPWGRVIAASGLIRFP